MLPLLLIALSWLGAGAADPAPLALGVYYEALCPDSRNFVVNQLNVTYSRVPEILELTFVPWGKAEVGDDGVIVCQHGPDECWGNRLLACAARAAGSSALQEGVVACLMDKQNSLHWEGQACVEAAGLSWSEQTACAESDASYQQALQNGQLTAELEPAVTFIPTVTLDGSQGSPAQQRALLSDLLDTVCSEWQTRNGQTPAGCP